MGRAQEEQGKRAKAAESYREAVRSDPKYLRPQIQLTLMVSEARCWPEAEQMSAAILKGAPEGLPGVYLVHAAACFNEKKFEQAEKSVREGLRHDTDHRYPRLTLLLTNVLEEQGDSEGAAEALRQYLASAPDTPEAAKARNRLDALQRQP